MFVSGGPIPSVLRVDGVPCPSLCAWLPAFVSFRGPILAAREVEARDPLPVASLTVWPFPTLGAGLAL